MNAHDTDINKHSKSGSTTAPGKSAQSPFFDQRYNGHSHCAIGPKQKFKIYPIGYVHSDITEMRTEEGQPNPT